MQLQITAAFNLRGDGSVVTSGQYAPATSIGLDMGSLALSVTRVSVGVYRVDGPGVYLPDGWRATVYRDENDEPTVRVALSAAIDHVLVTTTDPRTTEPMDIVHMLTLRVGLVVDAPDDAPLAVGGPLEVVPGVDGT